MPHSSQLLDPNYQGWHGNMFTLQRPTNQLHTKRRDIRTACHILSKPKVTTSKTQPNFLMITEVLLFSLVEDCGSLFVEKAIYVGFNDILRK